MELWNQVFIKPYKIINQEKLSYFNHNFFHGNYKENKRDTDTTYKDTILGVAVLLAPPN